MAADRFKGGPYDVNLGSSFLPTSQNDSTFYTIKYNFKPESIDPGKPGLLDEDSKGRVYVQLPHKDPQEGTPHKFEGEKLESKEIDCLLIFDEQTQTFTLERQRFSFTVKNNRSAQPITSSANVLALPPAASSSTVTTPQSDQVPTPANVTSLDDDEFMDEEEPADGEFDSLADEIGQLMDSDDNPADDDDVMFVTVDPAIPPSAPPPAPARALALPPGGTPAGSKLALPPTTKSAGQKRPIHAPKFQPGAAPAGPSATVALALPSGGKPAKTKPARSSSGSSSGSGSSSESGSSSGSSSGSGSESGSGSGSDSDSDSDLIGDLAANITQELAEGTAEPTQITADVPQSLSVATPPLPQPVHAHGGKKEVGAAAGPAAGVKPLSMRAYLQDGDAEDEDDITSSSDSD